ncbi:N,N-dimethylformamidase beta subunit family domain-containing protein, partial [Streptosporangium roseum]|uniref:N,N-dimethylformamidase beta subunit family domain-containing protein n=1 Tax=Streptosporangium roseum TaxID=2001 RepID=UPI001E5254E6
MSVNKGETLQFKVKTTATDYRLDIYRVGYYGGMGARQITTIEPSAALPQTQPTCLGNTTTGLIDCGNWEVSASWAVPGDAVSGVYLANMVREDGTSGVSQIVFVVRDDDRNSDILLKTSDSTWTAYNKYGGNSLYSGRPVGRAYKVSYNRPLFTRSSFFLAEYPLIRWIEANGYDVGYTSSIDAANRAAELLEHKIFISSGHDEYWSNEMRENIDNARNSGVNLIFFSGNEVFWKTRWENSIDQTGTPFRTLVCYKETHANAKIDPSPQWTGTWRDPRFSPPSDGGRPENTLAGPLYMVNTPANDAIAVPAEYGDMRLWRNTSIADLQPGQKATFPTGTLGYEWNEAPDDGFTPPGLVKFSRTTVSKSKTYLLDFGSTYGPGTPTHSLTLYRHASGALVFGSGTVQWSWGLDDHHDMNPSGGGRLGDVPPTDIRMQQATVNLLADMQAQPTSIQPGLLPATPSTDTAPPTSTITYPTSSDIVPTGAVVPIQGTAADTGGGVVGAVEISVDGGTRWFHATGRASWQYNWTTPTTAGTVTIKSRAVDDIGNIQGTPTEMTVTLATECSSCTLWPPSAVPAVPSQPDSKASTAGVKFKAAKAGIITGIRFYKGPQNTGTHTGSLWTSSGQLLASAPFTNETASGWQQVDFSTPVNIAANTTYIASYHTTS